MRVNIISKGDNIDISDPIIMILDGEYDIEEIITDMDIDKFYVKGNKLVIENPTKNLLLYIDKWSSLLKYSNNNMCRYETIFNIKRIKVYEYMLITNHTTKERFICLPTRIVDGNVIELEIGNI